MALYDIGHPLGKSDMDFDVGMPHPQLHKNAPDVHIIIMEMSTM